MNNTATIRALMAIVVVVVVVLIFTSGSLIAAAATTTSSSFTPQPQNLICTRLGNNATCSQEGIITTTTQIPLPTPHPQPSATLTIIKHVINDIVGTIFAKDFRSSVSGTNVSPQRSFPGTSTVTLKLSNFSAPLLQQANATIVIADHNKCSSSNDIVNCTHNKETHHPTKDTTTPFVLPIPFP